MGDYNVLIVSCRLKDEKMTKEDFKKCFGEHIYVGDSAYHDTAPFLSLDDSFGRRLTVSFILQTKWGDGMKQFLDWLEPISEGGLGSSDVWAIEFSEYSGHPKIRSRRPLDENNY